MSAHRDEVDRLIAAWKRERPDLDLSPFAVLSRISRISRNLDIARRDAFAELENWGARWQDGECEVMYLWLCVLVKCVAL